jgi:hypothetical protein
MFRQSPLNTPRGYAANLISPAPQSYMRKTSRVFSMTTQQGSFASGQKFVQAVAFSVFVLAVALSLAYTGYFTLYQTYLYLAYGFLALLAVLWLMEVFAFAAKLRPKPTNEAKENTTAVHRLPTRFKLAVALNIVTLTALVAYCALVAADTTLQSLSYFQYLFTAFMMAFLTSFVLLMFVASEGIPNQKRKGTP